MLLHSRFYNRYADVIDDVLQGVKLYNYNLYANKSNSFISFSIKDKIPLFDWSKVFQPKAVGGMPYSLEVFNVNKFNDRTFVYDSNRLSYFSGYLVGDTDTQIVNMYDPSDTDITIIDDILTSSWFNLLDRNYSEANSYLQSAMSLIGMMQEETLDIPSGNRNTRINKKNAINLRT